LDHFISLLCAACGLFLSLTDGYFLWTLANSYEL
jgi:hypothetical protein